MTPMPGWTQADIDAYRRKTGKTAAPLPVPVKPAAKVKVKGPNKTEMRYARENLSVNGVIKAQYEGITLRLPGGSRYTPDWYLYEAGAHTLVEVKGLYRFPSQGRAWTAWREARAAFPGFIFVWAELQKNGTWRERQENRRGCPQWPDKAGETGREKE